MVQSIDVCEGSNNLITAVNKDGALPPDGNKSIKWGEMEFEPNKINLKYDRNGNLTNDGVRSYFYDAENRLIKCNTSILLVNYKYDGLGRKVLEQESKDGAIFQENSFIYDGWSCVLELKTENLTLKTKSYILGLDLSGTLSGAGGVGGLLSVNSPFSKGGGGGFYFYCYDGNGNVINLVNIDTKEIAAHYEYDPFGRLIEKEGSYADRNFYRFSTKRVSPVFGIYDYGMRWYDPDFARWLTKDPIGEKGGLNLYGFVQNDPVNNIDPFGNKKLTLNYDVQTKVRIKERAATLFISVEYTKSFKELINKIKKKVGSFSSEGKGKCNCIKKIRLMHHNEVGDGGTVSFFGKHTHPWQLEKYKEVKGTKKEFIFKNAGQILSVLSLINKNLCDKKAVVDFVQCYIGAGKDGDKLRQIFKAQLPRATRIILPKAVTGFAFSIRVENIDPYAPRREMFKKTGM